MKFLAPKTSIAAQAVQDEVVSIHMTDDSLNEDVEEGKSSTENSSSNARSSNSPSRKEVDFRMEAEADKVCAVTEKDTKNVIRTKFLVYLSLALAATTVSTLTYIFTRREEESSFQVEVCS